MRKSFIMCGLISLGLLFAWGNVTHAKLIADSDWEDGRLNSNNEWGSNSDPSKLNTNLLTETHSATIVTAPVRAGKNAVKLDVQPGDRFAPIPTSGCNYTNGCSRPRAQLVRSAGQTYKIDGPVGSERWYGFSIYVPTNWVDGDEGFLGVIDWHGAGNDTSKAVPLGINLKRGNWDIGVANEFTAREDVYTADVDPDRGKWTDWVLHVIWDPKQNGNGLVEVWKNGKKVGNYHGPIYSSTAASVYIKIGPQYAGGGSTTGIVEPPRRMVYFDEFKIGDENSSYKEVAPQGAANPNEPPSSTSSSGGTTPHFCHQTTSSNQVPYSGFASPFNLFSSAKTLILKAFCNTTTLDVTAGEQNDLLYTYKEGYVTKNGSSWTKYTMTGESTQGDWIIGEASASIPMTASQQSTQNWLLSYSCLWTGTEWKCGCRTAECSGANGSMWQIQGIKR